MLEHFPDAKITKGGEVSTGLGTEEDIYQEGPDLGATQFSQNNPVGEVDTPSGEPVKKTPEQLLAEMKKAGGKAPITDRLNKD